MWIYRFRNTSENLTGNGRPEEIREVILPYESDSQAKQVISRYFEKYVLLSKTQEAYIVRKVN